MPYATVNGAKLWYELFGSGEPMVLLGGGGWAGSTCTRCPLTSRSISRSSASISAATGSPIRLERAP